MTALHRVRVGCTGMTGGPGVSTFYALDGAALVPFLQTFYTTLVNATPLGVTYRIENSGDIIEDTTGALTGTWVGGTAVPFAGSDIHNYAAPVGFVAQWQTNAIMDGSRVRGRTFVVPASREIFQDNGTLADAFATQTMVDGDAMITSAAGNFVVWHRPFAGRTAVPASGTHKAITAKASHLGGHAIVTACVVRDKAAVLRSRRD